MFGGDYDQVPREPDDGVYGFIEAGKILKRPSHPYKSTLHYRETVCVVGQKIQAKSIYPTLTGIATLLTCKNIGKQIAGASTLAFLEDYGLSLPFGGTVGRLKFKYKYSRIQITR